MGGVLLGRSGGTNLLLLDDVCEVWEPALGVFITGGRARCGLGAGVLCNLGRGFSHAFLSSSVGVEGRTATAAGGESRE